MSELAEALGDIRGLRQRVVALEVREQATADFAMAVAIDCEMGLGALGASNAAGRIRERVNEFAAAPAPAAPEPELADAEAAATQRGYRTGYADALAATAERDKRVRAMLEAVVKTHHLRVWTEGRVRDALGLLDGAP